MQFIEIMHSLLRTITYFNSALVVSNLLVWVILAVALKPERAIPATTAIIALLAHINNLQEKLLTAAHCNSCTYYYSLPGTYVQWVVCSIKVKTF